MKRPAGVLGLASMALVSQLGASGFGLLNAVLIGRMLGPEGRGQVAFLTTVGGMVGFIATLSVQELLALEFGRTHTALPRLLGASVVLACMLGGLGSVVAYLAVTKVPGLRADVDGVGLMWTMVAIPLIVLYTYLSTLLRSHGAHTLANLALLMITGVNLATNAALAAAGILNARTAILSWTIGQLAAAVAVTGYFLKTSAWAVPSRSLLARSVSFGSRAHVGGVITTGTYRVDSWLLGSLGSDRALGLYSVAVSWFEMMFLLPQALVLVLRPKFAQQTPQEAARQAARAVRVAFVANVIVGIGLFLAAPILCGWIFGPEFEESAALLRLLIPGAFGIAALKIFGITLIMQRHPLKESLASGLSFVVALIACVVLIPRFGATGAALSSTLSYLVGGGAAAIVAFVVLRVPWTELRFRRSDLAGRL